MLTKLGLLLAALAVFAVCIFCTAMHGIPIESAVQAGTSEQLQAASIAGVEVKADGREVTLSGVVPSEAIRQQAGDVAQASAGVRTVDNKLTVGAIATPPDAKSVQASINKILLDRKIEFQTSRDVLLPQSIPVLDEVLKVLNQAPALAVRIEGHTDNVGDSEMNRSLSKARAEAVVDWFASHGISKTRMTAAGFGADRPIAPNTTASGRFANRRVEIIAN